MTDDPHTLTLTPAQDDNRQSCMYPGQILPSAHNDYLIF